MVGVFFFQAEAGIRGHCVTGVQTCALPILLAYDIRKQREGTYAVFEAKAEPSMVKELERQLRLNENVLRFLSTRVPTRSKKARSRKAPEPPDGDTKVLEEVV